MFSSQTHRVVTSPKFKMLVAHNRRPSDPSKGEAGNPEPLRQVFETQVITTNMGVGKMGVASSRPTVLRIIVNSTDFADRNINPQPALPHKIQDQLQILGHGFLDVDQVVALRAGTHFAGGEGEGGGDEATVATELASILNDLKAGLKAQVDPLNNTHVLVQAEAILDTLFIRVYSYAYLLLGGDPPFIIEDGDGNTIYDPTLTGEASKVALIRANGLLPMQES